MNKMKTLGLVIVVFVGGLYAFNTYIFNEKQSEKSTDEMSEHMDDETMIEKVGTERQSYENGEVAIHPITHAMLVLEWADQTLYTDPTGKLEALAGYNEPDIVFVTDIHGDHLNTDTLSGVVASKTTIVAPQAVADLLPEELYEHVVVVSNGETVVQNGFSIEAIPMYNLPESDDSRHTKGRGNGYVIERDSTRVYIAGDTADIPEMRELQDIDIAFVPMNLPFTMDVETAADAVLAFKPHQVFPFHYRGRDGLSDTALFKKIVNQGDPNIEVVLHDWYPE